MKNKETSTETTCVALSFGVWIWTAHLKEHVVGYLAGDTVIQRQKQFVELQDSICLGNPVLSFMTSASTPAQARELLVSAQKKF